MIWVLDFDDFNNICGYGKYLISRVMIDILLVLELGIFIILLFIYIFFFIVGIIIRFFYLLFIGDGGKILDSGGGGSGYDGIMFLGNNIYIDFVSFKICCYIGIWVIILNIIFFEKSLYLRIIF